MPFALSFATGVVDEDADGSAVQRGAGHTWGMNEDGLPGDELNLRDAGAVCDVLRGAAEACRSRAGREGASVPLPAEGRLVVAGDLHDEALNFRRVLALADLPQRDDTHLVLQELIHGESSFNGMDLSIRTMTRAALLITRYPDRVVLLLANHDLAQIRGDPVLKGGLNMTDTFDAGLDALFGDRSDEVRDAMSQLVRALPLAARTTEGLLIAHSLPSPKFIDDFDKSVLDREPTEQDYAPPHGSAYLMVWGRHHTQKVLHELAEAWGVGTFLLGHQPVEMGIERQRETSVIVNSDHGHGMAVVADLAKSYDAESLVEAAVHLAGVRVG